MRVLALVTALLVAAALPAQAASWTVDHAKSRLGFSVQWSGEALNATFKSWDAKIDFDPANLAAAHVKASI